MAIESPDTGFPGNVTALTTNRNGGVSTGIWRTFNLATHVADDPVAVAGNRYILEAALPPTAKITWLHQVHGTRVIDADEGAGAPADASVCRRPGVACAILAADCLPVLLCTRAGDVVAAAHAGWRGLAAGVLEATVAAMRTPPGGLMAWLGPCIGPSAFEVGPEVREAFCTRAPRPAAAGVEACFRPAPRRGRFLADLQGLARQRLAALGLRYIVADERCTATAPQRFFSYRRDGDTGRMASLILINP